MFEIMNGQGPRFLLNLIAKCEPTIRKRNNGIPSFNCRTDCFKSSFFPSTLYDRFNLGINTRRSESIYLFTIRLFSFICPVQNKIYNGFDLKGLKSLTRLRLGLSHRFQHNFQDCPNPLCSCSLESEDTKHYLLHCHFFQRIDLMNSVIYVCNNFESMSNNIKTNILLYGDPRFNENENKIILGATITFIKSSERFSGSLFEQ